MTEKCFVDTNIFVYARDLSATKKQRRAIELIRTLWKESRLVISMQVITELCAVLSTKYGCDDDLVTAEAQRLLKLDPLALDSAVLEEGLRVRVQYKLSWWDGWIVGAAIVAGCTMLYSEDFADGVRYHNLVVKNPFAG